MSHFSGGEIAIIQYCIMLNILSFHAHSEPRTDQQRVCAEFVFFWASDLSMYDTRMRSGSNSFAKSSRVGPPPSHPLPTLVCIGRCIRPLPRDSDSAAGLVIVEFRIGARRTFLMDRSIAESKFSFQSKYRVRYI